ncbi:uncharacterized protein IL334_000708 [Kwoniella shivajii]|uniref:BZIP domain-containing protein n=1 Tax=Kwoniella shivajii TaxID=564305 RepID=A0ABZ1CQ30_9TREE|nr:hypothetical protein IL334_000708 [Kwoniella shivajii]
MILRTTKSSLYQFINRSNSSKPPYIPPKSGNPNHQNTAMPGLNVPPNHTHNDMRSIDAIRQAKSTKAARSSNLSKENKRRIEESARTDQLQEQQQQYHNVQERRYELQHNTCNVIKLLAMV